MVFFSHTLGMIFIEASLKKAFSLEIGRSIISNLLYIILFLTDGQTTA